MRCYGEKKKHDGGMKNFSRKGAKARFTGNLAFLIVLLK